jgi:hypothetical protein
MACFIDARLSYTISTATEFGDTSRERRFIIRHSSMDGCQHAKDQMRTGKNFELVPRSQATGLISQIAFAGTFAKASSDCHRQNGASISRCSTHVYSPISVNTLVDLDTKSQDWRCTTVGEGVRHSV